MIQLKTLLNEKNTRSKYDLIMDVIGEFIELKDQVDGRLLKIEELLQRLKPELDDKTQIDPVINQRGVFGLLLICFSLSYINP